jgi:hypothetical protein
VAEITAVHLMACLEQSGFVIMKKPPTQMHSAGVAPTDARSTK